MSPNVGPPPNIRPKPKAVLVEKPKPRWHELDFLIPYRDLFLIGGGGAILGGVFFCDRVVWNHTLAILLLGGGMIFLSWLMSRGPR